MKKVMFATLLGGFLGIFDGLTSLFTPEVRDQIVGIVIGSTVKGLVAGVLIGVFATRVRSLAWVLIFGVAGQRVLRLPGGRDAGEVLPRDHHARRARRPHRRLRGIQVSKLEERS